MMSRLISKKDIKKLSNICLTLVFTLGKAHGDGLYQKVSPGKKMMQGFYLCTIIVQSLGLVPTPYNWRPQLSLFICLWCNMWSWQEVWKSITPLSSEQVSWHELIQLTCLLTLESLSLSLSLSQPLDWKNCLPMSVIFKLVICKVKWLKLRTRKPPPWIALLNYYFIWCPIMLKLALLAP